MKNIIINFLLFIYTKIKASNKIRKITKSLFGNKKILSKYRKFQIYLGVNNSIQSNIIFNNYNEEFILGIIENFAKLNYSFVDIGANVGVHTLAAASVNSKIDVFSFEPEPDNFLELIRNIQVNNFSNIIPFKIALGNEITNTLLNVNDGWNTGKHTLKNHITNLKRQVNVPVLKLDLFQESLLNKNILLKIDVEGFEKEVLEGSNEILSRSKNIVLIIELISAINGKDICCEIVENLKTIGFVKVYRVNENKLIEVNEYEDSADYIFIKGEESLKQMLF